MTYPTKYTRQYDFASYQASNPTRPLPGTSVNTDFDAAKASIGEIVEFLKLFTRADGALANGSVGVNQLDSTFDIGFSLPTTWEAGVDYTTDSTVFYDNKFWIANVAHTSTDGFDESKWDEIVDFGEQATAAATSAAAALASQTAAATSATTATTQATASAASATAASDSATAAATSETNAATSATNAATSATAAAASATAAATSATAAATSETNAATSATEAAASAASAASLGGTFVDTVADLQAATVDAAVDRLYVREYYTGIGGGHWRQRSATLPPHTAYDTDASGAYWVIDETQPSLLQYGGKPYDGSFDNSYALNRFLSHANAPSGYPLREIFIPGGNWVFLARPHAIRGPCTIRGAGAQNTVLYKSYAEDNIHGLFNIVPDANPGFVLSGFSLIATVAGGAAIWGLSGARTDISITGTMVPGSTLTLNIRYLATDHIVTSTVAADTASTAKALGTAIQGNATLLAAGFFSHHSENALHIVGQTALAATITCTSDGPETISVGATADLTSGYIYLDSVTVTSANMWTYGLYLDGSLKSNAPLGVRSVFIRDCQFFGAASDSVMLKSIVHLGVTASETVLAGGTTGNFRLTGTAAVPSDTFKIDLLQVGSDLIMDYAQNGTVDVGIVNNYNISANVNHILLRVCLTAGAATWSAVNSQRVFN